MGSTARTRAGSTARYERTVKKVSGAKVKVKVRTFLLVSIEKQIVSIPEGHVTTHEKSDPVNESYRPYDLHLFKTTTWFVSKCPSHR